MAHTPRPCDAIRASRVPTRVLTRAGCAGPLSRRAATRHGGSWHADETIGRLITDGQIPPVVLLAIDHGGARRIHEFTPTRVIELGGGGAPAYAEMVFSAIANAADEYHVRADMDGLGMAGSSLGGLVTLWMASAYPGRFGRPIAMSPSVWWDRRMLLRQPSASADRRGHQNLARRRRP